jgi:hypothetical protein
MIERIVLLSRDFVPFNLVITLIILVVYNLVAAKRKLATAFLFYLVFLTIPLTARFSHAFTFERQAEQLSYASLQTLISQAKLNYFIDSYSYANISSIQLVTMLNGDLSYKHKLKRLSVMFDENSATPIFNKVDDYSIYLQGSTLFIVGT